ncbi:WD40-repeat-containing domain protein [Lipomyces arxii]|uniref:WD40-repeat-containing domain protein n=1 Tax=Lipomyces arxii TaxID=56418 RepID=UPI0034CF02A9
MDSPSPNKGVRLNARLWKSSREIKDQTPEMTDKRKDGPLTSSNASKRPRSTAPSSVAVVNTSVSSGPLIQAVERSSNLQAPIIQLSGHQGEVYSCRFDGSGQIIASGSQDKSILLWNVYSENENFGIIRGHKGAVLDLSFSRDSKQIYSASSDATLGVWDVDSGVRIRKHVGHDDVVNSIDSLRRGAELIASGSDDGSVAMWDPRTKNPVQYFETDFPILAVAFGQTGSQLFSAGIDHEIKVWDIRQQSVVYTLAGHVDAITSLNVSEDAQYLVSNSMDSTVRTWDLREFAPESRALNVYQGAPSSNVEKNLLRASFSRDGKQIIAGSADRTVVIWDTAASKILYKLPGHHGSVNDARFSPLEPNVVLSGSTDGSLMLGEIRL